MHARSTTIRGRPELIDDGIAFCRDEVLPMCREMPGCVGLSLIADRVEALDGRLQIMSPVGVGTTVCAEIPRTARGACSEPASIDGR